MKTPIEPSEIRKGDLIRVEKAARPDTRYRAFEYEASKDADERLVAVGAGGTYYLLERPSPPVVLPTEPTLGWATNGNLLTAEFGTWRLDDEGTRLRFVGASWGWRADAITAFVPATAVPTEALDALRGARVAVGHDVDQCQRNREAIDAFLTAVDNANGVGS